MFASEKQLPASAKTSSLFSGVVLDVIPVLSEMVKCAEKNLTNVEQYDTWVLWRRYTWNCPV